MIEIVNSTKERVNKKYFQEIGNIVLRKLKQPESAGISLVFVGDSEMRKLNRIYRGKDKTTNVLSFSYREKGKIPLNPPLEKGGTLNPSFTEGGSNLLGEIVISIPQAKKQAAKRSYPLKHELSELFLHGILHLVGYEDEREKDYRAMMKKQDELVEMSL